MTDLQPKPILLTWEMPDDLWIASFEPTGGPKAKPWAWVKEYKLPSSIMMSSDWNPNRMHLVTSSRIETELKGWSCLGQWKWRDTPIKVRNNLLQPPHQPSGTAAATAPSTGPLSQLSDIVF